MALAKTKPKIKASDVSVGNRTLEGVLLDLAEQMKINTERMALIDERSARAEERSARAEELAEVALRTIAAVSRDLQAMTLEMREENRQTKLRLEALESARGR